MPLKLVRLPVPPPRPAKDLLLLRLSHHRFAAISPHFHVRRCNHKLRPSFSQHALVVFDPAGHKVDRPVFQIDLLDEPWSLVPLDPSHHYSASESEGVHHCQKCFQSRVSSVRLGRKQSLAAC